ncbi:MAG: tRNA (adenosine(37)-N6)-threonylcarbamoyltransferase complex dimerization subunit type 1 TsaB [Defluviitaleaceae bacterium]|nr:tRNA (adenosine(37)-N6)-threonylcarbamoyltransferase complex dimerization subunit type 1 TsaB [Defluviitaleaceae bacterium]
MNILAIDTTGGGSGCAVISANENETKIIAEFTIAAGLTHSETIMPMIEATLGIAGLAKNSINLLAVAAGPGSFTGLRIGAACAKGLAMGLCIKIVPVSTLDAMAYNMVMDSKSAGFGRDIIVPIMDARRGQVYAAIYEAANGGISLLSDYICGEFGEIVEIIGNRNAVFLGDGVDVHKSTIQNYPNFAIAPVGHNLQRSALVGLIAAKNIDAAINPEDFELIYIRKPQAEREREGVL